MSEKKLYNVFHLYDTHGGFGYAVKNEVLVGTVSATPQEIAEFLEKWNNPVVYERPYASLYCHGIRVQECGKVQDVASFIPYNKTRNPYGLPFEAIEDDEEEDD